METSAKHTQMAGFNTIKYDMYEVSKLSGWSLWSFVDVRSKGCIVEASQEQIMHTCLTSVCSSPPERDGIPDHTFLEHGQEKLGVAKV